MKPNVNVDTVVNILNEMFRADPKAMQALVEYRVSCSDSLRDHNTAQVICNEDLSDPKIGLLGVLNGVVGIQSNGLGFLAGEFNENGDLIGFANITKEDPSTDE